MRVTFERVVVVEGSPEKLEKFLGENTFVYRVKGPNWEVWSPAPDFIRERYEGHFYLVIWWTSRGRASFLLPQSL